MKIYTKTGDDGTTGLFGGHRVSKADPRIECCGVIDELNACIGLAAACTSSPQLRDIQNELFVIGSHLATPAGSPSAGQLPPMSERMIIRLEHEIDTAETELPPLRQFILPGGSELGARLHLARAVCRRAERLLVALLVQGPTFPIILTYVNRLSDWLFVMARLANHRASTPEIPWQKPEC
jgi:cob(I)alamin adenosyltransferase